MKVRKLFDSFRYAIAGLVFTFRTQRNMRIHLIVAALVLVLAWGLGVKRYELFTLFITITLVLCLELINTAIEATVDLFTAEYHPLAKIAKNVAAGAVLLAAFNAVIVGVFIFWPYLF